MNGGRSSFIIIHHIIHEREPYNDIFVNSNKFQGRTNTHTHTKTIGTTEIGLRFKAVPAIKLVTQLYGIFICKYEKDCRLFEHSFVSTMIRIVKWICCVNLFYVSQFLLILVFLCHILVLLHLAFISSWMQLHTIRFPFFLCFLFRLFV